MKLSLIICTRNRLEKLKECIQPLIHEISEMKTRDVEILIVDNSSDNLTYQFTAELELEFPFVRSIQQPEPGLSISRNLGAENSKGDYVFFLDDDCVPEQNMIRRMMQNLPEDSTKLWQATGQILPLFLRPIPLWLNTDWLHAGFRDHKYLQGGLMGFSKQVFQLGYKFDASLGMKGNFQNYGEETLMSNQLKEMGVNVTFLPDVKASHDFTNYTKFSKVWKKSYLVGSNWPVVHQKNRWQTIISMKTNISGILRGVLPFLVCREAQNLRQRLTWSLLNLSELFGKLKSIIRGI